MMLTALGCGYGSGKQFETSTKEWDYGTELVHLFLDEVA
jgi:hypothetical protein